MSSTGGFGPPKEIIKSVYEIDPLALDEIAVWIEQRGLRTPISNLIGGSVALTRIHSGVGAPNTVVTAPVGSLYLRTDGGAATTLYVKESGTGNTGWVAK